MQRRLNQKLAEHDERERERQEEEERSRRAAGGSSRFRRSSSSRNRSNRKVEYEGYDNNEEKAKLPPAPISPRRSRSRRQSLLPSLDLEDRAIEEEFGQELLGRAFKDAERGSQADTLARSGVDVKFRNERMGAYLPGLNDNSGYDVEPSEPDRARSSSSRSASERRSRSISSRRNEDNTPVLPAPVSEELLIRDADNLDDNVDPGTNRYYEEIERGKAQLYGRINKFDYVDPVEIDIESASEDVVLDEEDVEVSEPPPKPPKSKSKSQSRSNSEPRSDKDGFRARSSLSSGSRTRVSRSERMRESSKSNLRSSSRDRLDRNSSTKVLGPADSDINEADAGSVRSNPRLGRKSGSSLSSRQSSRDVPALPIEMPESVSDMEAFRRYLSVRRGAVMALRQNIAFEEKVGEPEQPNLPPAMALMSQGTKSDTYRKTSCLCFAIVSLALLSASAGQLRFVVAYSKAHAYPVLNYFLICISIIIEVVAGVGYVILSRFPLADSRIDYINGYLISGLFVVAINNVIIAAFAFDDHVCEVLAKQTDMLDIIDQSPKA